MSDMVGTGDLAIWFEMTRAGVIKKLRRHGIKEVPKKGPRGESMWPRVPAVRVLAGRVEK